MKSSKTIGGSRLALWAAGLLVVAACGGNGAAPDATQAPGQDPTTTGASAPSTTLPPSDTTTVPGPDPDDVDHIFGECPLITEAEVKQTLDIDEVELSMADLDDFVGPGGETLEGSVVCNIVSPETLYVILVASEGTGLGLNGQPATFEVTRQSMLEGDGDGPPAGDESVLSGVGVEAYRYDSPASFSALARRGGQGWLQVLAVAGASEISESELVALMKAALAR